MSDIEKVTGSACLQYIDREIGFCDRSNGWSSGVQLWDLQYYAYGQVAYGNAVNLVIPSIYSTARIWRHDASTRKIGLIMNEYEDGGYDVAILGNDSVGKSNTKFFNMCSMFTHSVSMEYDWSTDAHTYIAKYQDYQQFPTYAVMSTDFDANARCVSFYNGLFYPDGGESKFYYYDEIFDVAPTIIDGNDMPNQLNPYFATFYQNNRQKEGYEFTINNDPSTTVRFGQGGSVISPLTKQYMYNFLRNNPLAGCSGNLWELIKNTYIAGYALYPMQYGDESHSLADYEAYGLTECSSFNGVCVPFNLLLTRDEAKAQAYLSNGTLPSDAFLFPMDWNNLPWYTPADDDGDGDDDNTPDDDGFGGDPNLPVVPYTVPANLSNYNWYWLQSGQFADFLQWFWNDIGAVNDWSDLFDKITGLYNDVASAILMCRYYPVNIDNIGGRGTPSNIKLGMIEKAGAVTTIDQTHPPNVINIGSIDVPTKYNSFVDLAPYSQLSLYLPFYGFVDLDINIFTPIKANESRSLDVKAVYDYLSGTIQYFIYCDNKYLINSYLAKIAVDIPLTLQTKNDRDSAIFSNVTNALSGLVGAGVTMASGNPLGLLVGAGAMNSGVNSAPMRVCGTVGETGALYAPPKCSIILRRPTISKPDNWARIVGQMCGKDYTLSNLDGKGFTKCYQPRIDFKNSAPLQTEIDEIYDYLEKGVIL